MSNNNTKRILFMVAFLVGASTASLGCYHPPHYQVAPAHAPAHSYTCQEHGRHFQSQAALDHHWREVHHVSGH